MTTRRALLISNPGELGAQNYCKGVFVDIRNYKNHLTSALGGAWLTSEIVSLNRPSRKEVDDEILRMSIYDYTVILFSGHGYYSAKSSSTIIMLRKDEEYDELELRKIATKRTIILDCCREVYIEPAWERIMVEAVKKAARPSLNLNECRKYYDATIDQCAKGVIIGYSCAINETSKDSESHGGYYAASLLKATKDWYDQKDIDLTTKYAAYSIVQAHNSAVPLVSRLSGGTQNPKIDKPRSEPYFPFAIMA